jgi:rhamnosyltransferase
MKHVFIIGSKGIPANYGGFETFVDNLVERQTNKNIKYHVSCMAFDNNEFTYYGARCFNVAVRELGSAKALLYDIKSINRCIDYIIKNEIKDAIIYILASRIGPYLSMKKSLFKRYKIKIYLNPDGHEWKRSKWNWFIKRYWKISESMMVKNSDLVICDSINIQEYINTAYKKSNKETTYISYGAEVPSKNHIQNTNGLEEWYKKYNITEDNYYLVVGRFVPENNYKLIIKEFMKSNTKKDLVIITNIEKGKYYTSLLEKTNFCEDSRVKFVGTVYDQELLSNIRINAFAYIHGHSVGGTNPSLLEALSTTKLNLLYNVSFNKEVGEDAAFYFSDENGNLGNQISVLENLNQKDVNELSLKSKNRIKNQYSWEKIIIHYESLFVKS